MSALYNGEIIFINALERNKIQVSIIVTSVFSI